MRSIRRQLTLGVLVVLGSLLGGVGLATYWSLRASIYEQFDEALRVKALFIVTSTQQRNNQIKVEFSDGFLREFDYDVATDFFQLFDESGTSLTRSDSLSGRNLPLRYGTLAKPVYWDLQLPNGQPGRAIGIEFAPDQQNRRGQRKEDPMVARVVMASERRHVETLLARLNATLAFAGAAMVGLIVLAVPLVLRRGLRPLDRVAERASMIDANSLEERFEVEAMPAELRPIASRLNDLLGRLAASFERERRFSANLAHELRTPLAELRAQAELALKWPEERTAEGDRAVLEIVLQMEALAGRMLELARAEQSGGASHRETVGVAALLEEVLAPLQERAAARGLKLERAVDAGMSVASDPVLLRSIITNLLENAVNYAKAGSFVRVEVGGVGAAFVFRVSNPTDNLSKDDLPRLFERFWRKDPARTGGGSHSGLGLALSRAAAERIGCTLEAGLDGSGVLTLILKANV